MEDKKNSVTAYNFTIGLLYPAVLGSIIFNLFYELSHKTVIINPERYILVLFILIHYIMDYLYTTTDKIRNTYNWKQGFFDFVIVLILFMITAVVNEPNKFVFLSAYIPIMLGVTKLMAFLWECVGIRVDRLAKTTFLLFSILYFSIQFYNPKALWLLIFTIVFDICIYYYFESIRGKLNIFIERMFGPKFYFGEPENIVHNKAN